MKSAWIVVADASRARFFSAELPASPLCEIETLSNPEARLHEGDLVSDRSGRDRDSGGSSHGFGSAGSAKEEIADRFAADVSARLESGRERNAFYRLYVLGSPSFLGMLRKHQSPSLRRLVVDEIAKDMTMRTPEQIRAQLPDRL